MKARDMSLIIVCVLFVVLSGLYMLFSNRLPELSVRDKEDGGYGHDNIFQSLYQSWFGLRNGVDGLSTSKKKSMIRLQTFEDRSKQLRKLPPLSMSTLETQDKSRQDIFNNVFSVDMSGSSDSQLRKQSSQDMCIDEVFGVKLIADCDNDIDASSVHSFPQPSTESHVQVSLYNSKDSIATISTDASSVSDMGDQHNLRSGGMLQSVRNWFQSTGEMKVKSALKLEALNHTSSMDADPFQPAKSSSNLKNRSFKDAVDITASDPQQHCGALSVSSFYTLQGDVGSFDDTSINGSHNLSCRENI
jgi:hypothetical protein